MSKSKDVDAAPLHGIVMTREQQNRLATTLADALFNANPEQTRPTTRLQFKSGKYPDSERDEGGLCHIALVSLFRAILQDATSS